jgi:hypothetical protein
MRPMNGRCAPEAHPSVQAMFAPPGPPSGEADRERMIGADDLRAGDFGAVADRIGWKRFWQRRALIVGLSTPSGERMGADGGGARARLRLVAARPGMDAGMPAAVGGQAGGSSTGSAALAAAPSRAAELTPMAQSGGGRSPHPSGSSPRRRPTCRRSNCRNGYIGVRGRGRSANIAPPGRDPWGRGADRPRRSRDARNAACRARPVARPFGSVGCDRTGAN